MFEMISRIIFLTLGRDLAVNVLLPTKDLDHSNGIHDLSYNLNARICLEIALDERESMTYDFIFSL